MRRGYFCVEARPIVNRRDDASIPRAEEIVDVSNRVGGVRSGQVVLMEVGHQAAEDVLPRAAVDERRVRLHGPSHLCGAAAGPATAGHSYFQPFGAPRVMRSNSFLQSTVLFADSP